MDYLSVSLSAAVPKCSVSDMDEEFLDKLLFAQKLAGKKFRINSAFRSVAYEKEHKRSRYVITIGCKHIFIPTTITIR